jgi:pilus assembly protein CpaF
MAQSIEPTTSPAPAPRQVNGHAGHAIRLGTAAHADDKDETQVVRSIQRQVAKALTDAARTYDRTAGVPMTDSERQTLTRHLITQALDGYADECMKGSPPRPPLRPDVESRVARKVADSLMGAGGLQPLLNNPRVEEITAEGCDIVHVRLADGTVEQVAPIADSDEDMVDLVRLLAARTGVEERRWDRAAPILNLQLPDGSRLNAVMAVCKRPSLSIRRHRYVKVTLDDLVRLRTLDTALRELLAASVRARLNIVVAGRTGAGKTTLLRGLASQIPPGERLVTIEDTYELGLDADSVAHPRVVALQVREANVEGEGSVDMATLFRNALRMVPDRIIVGEVRGNETIPMLNAMSQGNDGSLSTVHARSSGGVFRKLALYAAQSPERLDEATTNLHIAEGLDLVVHLGFADDGRRTVTSVREVIDADGLQVASNEIFRPGPGGRAVPGAPISTGTVTALEGCGFDPELMRRAEGWWDHTGVRR